MEERQLTANDLRRLAEAVDGIRDQPAYVTWGKYGPEVTTEPPAARDVIFECVTKSAQPDRAKLRLITVDSGIVDAGGRPITDLATRADAMFWSEAAVEKFVLPYYIRSSTPGEVARMAKAFDNVNVVATTHMPDSTSMLIVRGGDANLRMVTLQEFEASP